MANPTPPAQISDQQKREFCAAISLGSDRETARKFQGWTDQQLRTALRKDPQFDQQLQRAEATAELTHVRNLHSAAAETKNWRVSVWWLERRSPERYGDQRTKMPSGKKSLTSQKRQKKTSPVDPTSGQE